jgi:hypothetical protein
MKALKVVLLVIVLLGLGIVAGCQEGYSSSSSVTGSDRVVWEQGLTGFPHPSIAYTDAR